MTSHLKKAVALLASAVMLATFPTTVSFAVSVDSDFQFEITNGGLSTLQRVGDPTQTNFVRNDRGYRLGNLELAYNNASELSGYQIEVGTQNAIALYNAGRDFGAVGSSNGGGAFEIQDVQLADFTYEATITPLSGSEAGLVFRAGEFGQSPQGLVGYYIGIFGNKLQLLKTQGIDFPYVMGNSAAYSFNREYNRPYRLKVEAVGANIKIYLDGVKVIDVTDAETPDGVPVYTDAGSFGFRTYNGSGCFSNVKISDAQGNVVFEESNLEEHGKTFGGDWSYKTLPIDQSAGFQDTSVTSSIRITSGQEAGLAVKASGTDVTASTFTCYFASINASTGKVYLMKPQGRDYPWLVEPVTPQAGAIVRDRDYQVKVETMGSNIKVYVNDELVIDYTDPQPIEEGYAGYMAYNGSAIFSQFELNDRFSDNFKQDLNWIPGEFGSWTQLSREDWAVVKTQDLTPVVSDLASGKEVAYSNLPCGLNVTQQYETRQVNGRDALELTVRLENSSAVDITLGDLALPLPLNNAWVEGNQEVTQTQRVFPHYFVSQEGSFIYASHPDGTGPYLLMLPGENTKLEYLAPIDGTGYLSDFLKAYVHSGYTGPNTPGTWRQEHTSGVVPAGGDKSYSFEFFWAEDLEEMREVLYENSIDVQVVPGMTIPEGLKAKIAVRSMLGIDSVEAEYPDETVIDELDPSGEYSIYELEFGKVGENKITVNFGDGKQIHLEFFYTKPIEQLLKSRTDFISRNQQVKDESKVYDGLFSQWSMEREQMTTPENTMGLHMYAVSGSDDPTLCKAPTMAQLNMVYPDAEQIANIEYYLENFVWGGLQRTPDDPQSEWAYGMYGSDAWWLNRPADSGVPDLGPDGNGGHGAGRMWRSFDYTHMIQLYYNMYTIAENYPEMVNYLDADGYLERAYHTAMAFYSIPYNIYMKGWNFNGWCDWAFKQGNFHEVNITFLIDALEREGKTEWADDLRSNWETKVKFMVYDDPYPFGSEMAYDTTAFESTHAIAKYGMEHDISGGENDFYDKNLNGPGQGGYRSHTDVDKDDVYHFMKREIQANQGSRAMVEPAYYLLGSDMRGTPYSLSYMTQLGGWGLMDYAQYYSETPAEDMRIAYASYLAPYALFNTGEDYPWYGSEANEGALAWAFQPLKNATTWLGFNENRGPWRFDGENDSGIAGGMRSAATVVVDDPIFGLFTYGGTMQRDAANEVTTVQPMDGINQRYHLLTVQKLHMILNRDNFSSVTVKDDRSKISFIINNITGDMHTTRLSVEGLDGAYDLLIEGEKIDAITLNGETDVEFAVPAKAEVSVVLRSSSEIPSDVDKAALKELVEAIDGKYEESGYTAESWAELEKALEEAKAVIAKADA
ncbi:hypothetical protein H8711_12940, partial [Clostridiaceae bacterium NSJ-31]